MHTLREWRLNAEQRGFERIAELCDYLQADELNHVKLASRWIRALTEADPKQLEELVKWSRSAVRQIEEFYSSAYGGSSEDSSRQEPHFAFLSGAVEEARFASGKIIGE
jgi:rubrerythrin